MMIFSSIYGVVDGFFVSNFVGKTPFAAVNLIMPFLCLLGAVGFMFGTGGSAIVAKTLGEGDRDKANKLFSLFVYVVMILGTIIAVIGIAFMRPIASFLGAEGEMLENCVVYGRISAAAIPFFMLQVEFQSFFVTTEKPQLGLAVTVVSGVTNMVLDALLVAIIPMGLVGAALATALSQAVGGALPLLFFCRENTGLLRLKKTSFDGAALIKACTNGSSEFVSNISMSLVGMLYNFQLLKFEGENGVAAYGVMMYVSMIFCAAFIGYSVGTAPVIGYNDGAQNHKELKNVLKKSLILIGIMSVIMFISAQLLAFPFSILFTGYDNDLMALTLSGFKIFAFSFIFMGYAIFASGFFTALNDGLTSALISFLRTVVFQIAAVMILPALFNTEGIWWSVSVAELMAVIISTVFMIIKRKKYHY